jgi:hypothetical protein
VQHERDALLATRAQVFVADAMVEAVPVLYAHDRGDGLGLREMVRADIGDAQVPDQAGVAQFRERSEVLGDRVEAVQAEVDYVQMVPAELTQVLLD